MSLELKMYFLVPYQIIPIQQGIQSLHAVARFARATKDIPKIEELYNDWVDNHETVIVLNGGTTNTNPDRLGTLNVYLNELTKLGVFVQPFYEPDLGDQLTSIGLLVDERVFNKEKYPDFNQCVHVEKGTTEEEYSQWKEYREWVEMVGGEQIVGLRKILNPLRLA